MPTSSGTSFLPDSFLGGGDFCVPPFGVFLGGVVLELLQSDDMDRFLYIAKVLVVGIAIDEVVAQWIVAPAVVVVLVIE